MTDAVTIAVDPAIDLAAIEHALDEGQAEIEQEAQGVLAQLSWPMVRERLALAIRDALGKDMMPWLASAWTTARELHQFKDAQKYPPGTESFYNMVPQALEGSLHPAVSVSCAGAVVTTLTFDVTVTADFHCIALVIRDAQIIGFGGGDYAVTLKIGLKGHDLSGPIELDKARLPGKLTFARGLPIP